MTNKHIALVKRWQAGEAISLKELGATMQINNDSRKDEMREQTAAFHKQHPEVWNMFVKFTFQMIDRGYKNYSAQHGIFARIRWEHDSGGDGVTVFKLNNNYSAFYARRFMKMYPEHEGFFRTRKQTSGEEDATDLPELTPSDYEYESG
jgi:hypothetical protein